MKRNRLFKTLIDILFLLQTWCFSALLLVMPFGITGRNVKANLINNWTIMHWLSAVIGILSYVFLIIALFHLRKTARFMLSNNHFTEAVIKGLRKSGFYFVYVSGLLFLMLAGFWVAKLATNIFITVENVNVVTTLFIAIIGLFFIIQSDVLLSAKLYKEDNDLTI